MTSPPPPSGDILELIGTLCGAPVRLRASAAADAAPVDGERWIQVEGGTAAQAAAAARLLRALAPDPGERPAADATAPSDRAADRAQRRAQAVERALLDRLVAGDAPERVLELLIDGIEQTIPGAIGNVLLVDPADPAFLRAGAGPRVPPAIVAATKRFPIGPGMATCGTAASRREPVYTHDIRTDPAWASARHLAVPEGLLACWSHPILDAQGAVLGTFAVYLGTVGAPAAEEREVLGSYAQLASLALQSARTRAALVEREALFEAAASATTQVVYDWDVLSDRVRWHTAGMEGALDIAPLPDSIAEFWYGVHPEDRDEARASLERAIASGATAWAESYRIAGRDGGWLHIVDRGRMFHDDSGRVVRMVGGIIDDTARRTAERRLAEQAAVLDHVRSAIVVFDLEGRVEVWNRAATGLYGHNATTAIGRTAIELGLIEPQAFEATLRLALREGLLQRDERILAPDATTREVRTQWLAVRDARGTARSLVLVQVDETHRRQLERRQLRAQRLESIGTLAGGVAHDLNNVLTPILASIGLVRTAALPDHVSESLDLMERSAERGAAMVRQLLLFARGAEGEQRPVDVGGLLREIGRITRETLPHGIELGVDVPEGLPLVLGDATQLHQVFLNLVVNARDAMPSGGRLDLYISQLDIDRPLLEALHAEGAVPGPYLRVCVRDTGTGLAPEVRERMFEPFFTTKPVGAGTGLGLSTVLALVRGHAGFVHVDSAIGFGTTFAVYLPVSPDATLEPTPPTSVSLPSGSGRHILVVDDEPAVRSIAQRILQAADFRVDTAADGAQGLARFSANPRRYALVLTDLMMPVMGGLDLIAEIRKISADVPILAFTGLDAGEAEARVLAAGGTRLLHKPFTRRVLLTVVDEVLAGR